MSPGAFAWAAAGRGLRVHLGGVAPYLESLGEGSLSGIVLSGVLDRVALEDQVGLVDLAAGRLAAGGALVLIGTRPAAAASGRDALAQDLLPGRPLHPETWALLLDRAGFGAVEPLEAPEGTADIYAVGGRWGR